MRNRDILFYVLQGLIAVTFFASIPTVIRLISADPITIGFVRLAGAVGVGCFFLVSRSALRGLTVRDWGWLCVLGFLFGLHWLLYFYAIKIGNASIAIVGVSSYGIQMTLISIFFHGRPFYRMDFIALLTVILGQLLVIPEFSLDNNMTFGFCLGIMSAFFCAVLPSIHQKNVHINSQVRSFGQLLFAGVFFSFLFPGMNFDLSRSDWASLVYLSIVATLIANTLWVRVVTRVSAVPVSLMYYLSVPFGILCSVVVLDEKVTWNLVAGASLILVGNFFGMIHQIKNKAFFINEESA